MHWKTTSNNARQAGLALLPLLLVLLLLLAVAGAAVAGTYFYTHRAAPANTAKTKAKPPVKPTFVKLDPFTVNLGGDSGRVLYIGLSLDVAGKAAAERVKARMPQVRDRVLMTLTGQNAQTLATSRGKQRLAAALRDGLRKPYTEHGQALAINSVLFTDFIVQ